ncbi:hypothetical protein [Bremerella alba]|uniref:Uncharacterized protein n=1 Tax=Bremerella alba TaxID=980252 RepID=A0A7V9A677_9BACT|nr:hypothetical protein [Bremerella alba]MBA2113661.1 hypothetical protein [Bremerella alba]
MKQLSQYCRSRLGFDPSDMSEDELRKVASVIIETMATEIGLMFRVVEKGREVAKAAEEYGKQVPYEVIREERLPCSDDLHRTNNDDPNAILDSIFVFTDPE